jgi:hypothetical protein
MPDAKQVEPSSPAVCWVIYDEHKNPLRSGISFNSETEAWRCYFCNRSGWEQLREFSRQHGYKCVRATLTPNAGIERPMKPQEGA